MAKPRVRNRSSDPARGSEFVPFSRGHWAMATNAASVVFSDPSCPLPLVRVLMIFGRQ